MTNPASNIAILNRFFEAETSYIAAGGGDFGPIAATLDPECVIYQPSSLPYGGEWRGLERFEAWMKAFTEQWSSLKATQPEFFPCDDAVTVRSHVHARARTTGTEADWPLLQLFRFRSGRILELQPFYWDTASLLPALLAQSPHH